MWTIMVFLKIKLTIYKLTAGTTLDVAETATSGDWRIRRLNTCTSAQIKQYLSNGLMCGYHDLNIFACL